jgi:UDP-N-acetylmuramoylalanine--D-glutamate ligase
VPVTVAGNVGTALTSLPGTLDPAAVIVCEASSFQLEDTLAFAPDAAVLLNLQEDHLDRHGTFENYRAAKLAVFAHQPPGTIAVVPAGLALEDTGGEAQRITFGDASAPDLTPGADAGPSRVTPPSDVAPAADAGPSGATAAGDAARVPELAHRGGQLFWRGEPLMPASDIRLRGPHNRANAMAAAAVCLARGLAPGAVREGLETFAGVPHRLEQIGNVAGVTYVNDSKATNVASAEVGIRSFAGGVHLIAGGSEKGSDFTPLAIPVEERCKAVYLIGETAPRLRAALEPTGLPIDDAGDLETAFAHARRAAEPGDVVLLSPGCASYDQFRSYEERGDRFRDLVSRMR